MMTSLVETTHTFLPGGKDFTVSELDEIVRFLLMEVDHATPVVLRGPNGLTESSRIYVTV